MIVCLCSKNLTDHWHEQIVLFSGGFLCTTKFIGSLYRSVWTITAYFAVSVVVPIFNRPNLMVFTENTYCCLISMIESFFSVFQDSTVFGTLST